MSAPPPPPTLPDAVVPTNPYSRLMALQRMGVVPDYARIRSCSIAVVGVGGVGAVAADMLARCGVGRLLLFDCDTVEHANLNRLFYTPSQVGLPKVEAAAATLGAINPDVVVEGHHIDITTMIGCAAFEKAVGAGGVVVGGGDDHPPSPVTLILSCVDNYAARATVNAVALDLGAAWLEAGVSEDAVSGHIQLLVPGQTACYSCAPPLAVAAGVEEATLRREGVCAASLPTTMGIVAGLLVQAALKRMLGFGTVAGYIGYASLCDHFTTLDLKPNPTCTSAACVRAQARWAASEAERRDREGDGGDAAPAPAPAPAPAAEVVHEDNEWGIEVVGGGGGAGGGGVGDAAPAAAAAPPPPDGGGAGVDDLMAQLAALGGK